MKTLHLCFLFLPHLSFTRTSFLLPIELECTWCITHFSWNPSCFQSQPIFPRLSLNSRDPRGTTKFCSLRSFHFLSLVHTPQSRNGSTGARLSVLTCHAMNQSIIRLWYHSLAGSNQEPPHSITTPRVQILPKALRPSNTTAKSLHIVAVRDSWEKHVDS